MVLCVDLQNSGGRQVPEEHASFNLRLYDVAIYLIAKAGVGPEQSSAFGQEDLLHLPSERSLL